MITTYIENTLKVPSLDLSSVGAAQKGHQRQKSYSKNSEINFDSILPQNDDFGLAGAVPISAVPAIPTPSNSDQKVPNLDLSGLNLPSKSSKTSRNHHSKRHMSMMVDSDDFPNVAKNEILANNLYGEHHDVGIDNLLADDNIPQWKKQDLLFNMFDENNYTIDETQILEG